MSPGRPKDDRTLLADLTELVGEYAAMHRQAAQDTARTKAELNRMRDVLGQTVHDLRTPLTTIVGLSEILLDSSLDDRHQQMVLAIEGAASRMRVLAEDLLAAVAGGREPATRRPVDLRELAAAVTTRHRLLGTPRRMVLVERSLPDRPPLVVLGDVAKLERALDNLVDNAIKFSTPGTTITISVTDAFVPDSSPSEYDVRLTVRDDGIGIPPDELVSVFEPFHRAPNAARVSGAGLGLAIVRDIARLHGGDVSVSSEPGGGTAFTVLIPALPPAVGASELVEGSTTR